MEEEERSKDSKIKSTLPKTKWISKNKYLSASFSKKPKPESSRGSGKLKPTEFTCDKCNKKYSSNYALIVHSRSHTGEKPFPCEECEKSFSTNYQLERHQFSHSKLSDVKCEVCEKLFPTKDALEIHMRSHTGERPFSCDKCDNKYPSRSSLNRHLASSHGGDSFLCDECGKTFSSSGTLQIHLLCHVRERNFPCNKCRLRFKRQMDLHRHLKTHTEIARLSCPFEDCKHQFRRRDNLLRHLRLTHEINNKKGSETAPTLDEIANELGSEWRPTEDSPITITSSICNSDKLPNDNGDEVVPTEETHISSNNDQHHITWNTIENPPQPPPSQPEHVPHLTNQRSVIRSTESLGQQRYSQPQNNVVSTPRDSFVEASDHHESWNKANSRNYNHNNQEHVEDNLEPCNNNQVNQPDERDQSLTIEKPTSSQSFIREFHYGTLFPYKPHVQPEKFRYHSVGNEDTVANAVNVQSVRHPYEISENILDLSDSNYHGHDIHPNIIYGSAYNSNIAYENNLTQLGMIERPQNVPVIRRASPINVPRQFSFSERIAHEVESSYVYNQVNQVLPTEFHTPVANDTNNSAGVEAEYSDNLNEVSENLHSYRVNEHVIRDPRKNFLWEHFNKQYK